jgi:exosortase
MELLLQAIFWLCVAGVLYAYMIYPILLGVFSRLFGREDDPAALSDERLPKITLLIAAHNEEAVIARRIEDALAMDYPRNRYEILIASDGSTDRTQEIVQRYAPQGVRLIDYRLRRGKAAVLNATMALVRSEIVLLSDANTSIAPNAARQLVRWFARPEVGAVCGRLVLTDPASGRNVDSAYWHYETRLKVKESRLGALLGANGAIYAIRRRLFQTIPDGTIVDDFVIPLLIKSRTGCDIVYDRNAVASEECAPNVIDEFWRRARIGAGGWQAISILWRLLDPRQGWVAFTFLSHKVLRWLCPFFLIGILLASAALCRQRLFMTALAAQLVFYLAPMLESRGSRGRGAIQRGLRLARMFSCMNLALLVGFGRWCLGLQRAAWNRTPRMAETLLAQMGALAESMLMHEHRVKGWDLILAGGAATLAVFVTLDAWRDILRLGLKNEELGYVLLAPIMIIWIAWVRRQRLWDCTVRGGWLGLCILAAGWGTFQYGFLADPVLWRAGAVLIAIGAVVSVLGSQVFVRFLPAFAATIFLVPVSPYGRYQVAIPLQEMTADVTQRLCDAMGIYVMRSGNLLSINGVDVTVAEACNGMRMVFTLFMACYVVAFTLRLRPFLRIILLASSPAAAIVFNVMRLVPTVWMFGYHSDYAEVFHTASGWGMTILAFIILMALFGALERFLAEPPADERVDASALTMEGT